MTTLFRNLIACWDDGGGERKITARLAETDLILLVNRLVNSARGELLDA